MHNPSKYGKRKYCSDFLCKTVISFGAQGYFYYYYSVKFLTAAMIPFPPTLLLFYFLFLVCIFALSGVFDGARVFLKKKIITHFPLFIFRCRHCTFIW